jgi:hypothetical protein
VWKFKVAGRPIRYNVSSQKDNKFENKHTQIPCYIRGYLMKPKRVYLSKPWPANPSSSLNSANKVVTFIALFGAARTHSLKRYTDASKKEQSQTEPIRLTKTSKCNLPYQ